MLHVAGSALVRPGKIDPPVKPLADCPNGNLTGAAVFSCLLLCAAVQERMRLSCSAAPGTWSSWLDGWTPPSRWVKVFRGRACVLHGTGRLHSCVLATCISHTSHHTRLSHSHDPSTVVLFVSSLQLLPVYTRMHTSSLLVCSCHRPQAVNAIYTDRKRRAVDRLLAAYVQVCMGMCACALQGSTCSGGPIPNLLRVFVSTH